MMKLRAVQQTGGEDVVAGYEPEGDMVEAKYEAGASNYGKMSIRNKRAVGYGGNAAPPEERQKAHNVRMKKHMTNKGKSAIDPKKNPMSEAYGGKGVSRKAKLASLHPPTAQAAVKNIPTETDRGAGNKAMRRAGKTVEKKSPTYKAHVANKMGEGFKGYADLSHMETPEQKKARDERLKKFTANSYREMKKKDKIKIGEATRYSKETGKSFKTGKPVVKGGTAKDDKAFQYVAKKYASQMMGGQQKKKVRGQKPDDSNTPFKRAAARIKQVKADNKAFASRAKKAGFKSTQDYANTVARYGGEKDYQNPNKRGGLGS